jgi:hypothetical protein
VVNDPVIQLDVLPTALAACSVVPPSGGSEPANSLLKNLSSWVMRTTLHV